jgi:1-acyl-sn-glycerol-3-phosphate acyltransferase
VPDSIPPPLAPSYVAHGGRLGGWLLSVSEAARFYAVLAAFPLLCLAWSLPARLLTILLPRRIQPRLGRFGITTGFRLYLGLMRLTGLARFDLSALDRLREDRGVIIIANHRSLIDAVLMLSRLPRVTCISKAALWNSLMLGGGMRLAGYIRNDSAHALIRTATAALRRGEPLLVFPEGTRGTAYPIGQFKSGVAMMAKATGASVQTVFLESNTTYLHKGRPALRKPAFPLIYRARLGRRFEATDDVQDFVTELEAYFRAELESPRLWPRELS